MEQAAANSEAESGGLWSLIVDVWDHGVFGVGFADLFIAAAILMAFVALRHVISGWLRAGVEALTRRTASGLDDQIGAALERPLSFVPVVIGVFIAGSYLDLTGLGAELFDSLMRSLVVFTLFWALVRLVDPLAVSMSWIERHITRELASWLWRATRVLLWLIGGATIVETWGINVASVIAGFGLIGVAVALGAQDLFKNLISGVLILTEKRLKVGDWVKVDDVVEGTVEVIGFRSTKVRQFDKAPVYVANKEFADGAVVNYGEMTNRRIYWRIGLEYRTTAEQLTRIREEIEATIMDDDRFLAPPDASMFVRIDSFAASSIDLLLYCFTRTRDWGEWLQIKEELLLKVKRIVEDAGAGFAFPSQSLYIESAPEGLSGAARPEAGDTSPGGAHRPSQEGVGEASSRRAAPTGAPDGPTDGDETGAAKSASRDASESRQAALQATDRAARKSAAAKPAAAKARKGASANAGKANPGESKTGESKTGGSKTRESKTRESKTRDAKTARSRSAGGAKSAPTPAPVE